MPQLAHVVGGFSSVISSVATISAVAPPFAHDLLWTGGARCRGGQAGGAAAGVGEQADLVRGHIRRSRSVVAVTNQTLPMCQTPAPKTATLARQRAARPEAASETRPRPALKEVPGNRGESLLGWQAMTEPARQELPLVLEP